MNTNLTHSLSIGTVLNDKWIILEFIAKGAMGEVYRAHQLNLKRDIAIKVVSSDWLQSIDDDEKEIETTFQRFRREVQAMAQIHHPNVIEIFDHDSTSVKKENEDVSIEYIAMEYIPGNTLRSTMSEDGFHPDEAATKAWLIDYFLPVISGVRAMHEQEIVHRDLKPENILLDGDTPKIADFGLARSRRLKSITHSIDTKGTPPYMSPEHFFDFRRADEKSDIYSLGKILYEAVDGKLTPKTVPFKSANLQKVDTPFFKKLDKIVRSATEEEKNERFGSIEEFRKGLLEAIAMDVEKRKYRNKRWQKETLAVLLAVLVMVWGIKLGQYYLKTSIKSKKDVSEKVYAFRLPSKPSIAVLPFYNLSSEPGQDSLADAITENLITEISIIPEMDVMARSSVFTYKDKPMKIQQVCEELEVRYALEGSIQKTGRRIRVTAQLIDALSGHHLWAKNYDRSINDIFVLQDELAKEIAVELQVNLTDGESARVLAATQHIEAWRCVSKAHNHIFRLTKEDNTEARNLLKRAISIDPEYLSAWIMLARTHFIDARFGFSESFRESIDRTSELTQTAQSVDASNSEIHAMLGSIHMLNRNFDEAIEEGQKSIMLSPNNNINHILLAETMYFAGRFQEAAVLSKKAMNLCPYYPPWYLALWSRASRMLNKMEEALSAGLQVLDRSQKGEYPLLWAHLYLVDIYMKLGQEKVARKHAAEVLKIEPNLSLDFYRKTTFYKNPVHLQSELSNMHKAGFK